MNNTIHSHLSETTSSLTHLADTLKNACADLIEVLGDSIEAVQSYGGKALEGVSRGVKALTVDTILGYLNQIDVLIKEIANYNKVSLSQFVVSQKQELLQRFASHPFFQDNFAWRVQEIVQRA